MLMVIAIVGLVIPTSGRLDATLSCEFHPCRASGPAWRSFFGRSSV